MTFRNTHPEIYELTGLKFGSELSEEEREEVAFRAFCERMPGYSTLATEEEQRAGAKMMLRMMNEVDRVALDLAVDFHNNPAVREEMKPILTILLLLEFSNHMDATYEGYVRAQQIRAAEVVSEYVDAQEPERRREIMIKEIELAKRNAAAAHNSGAATLKDVLDALFGDAR